MLILLFLFTFYILFISFQIYATIRLLPQTLGYTDTPGISVIVAIRNGEQAVPQLIKCLQQQNYSGPLEFILVDDESNDKTSDIIISSMEKDNRIKYFSSIDGNNNLSNKKKALDYGIKKASYNYLLFSDVDCIIPETWVKTMSQYYQEGYDYLVGASIVDNSTSNFISIFQRIDFLLLMIICRASNYFGYPLACSGQNQGFTRELYYKSGGFIRINQFIGDDTAFLQHCNNLGCSSIFVDNVLSIITSRRELKFSHFISQRVRWVSDANKLWKININFFFILFLSFIFFISLPILISVSSYSLIATVFFIKTVLEFCLLLVGSKYFKADINFLDFLLWQVLHIPYIIVVGTLSYFPQYFTWKERRIN